MSTFDFYAVSNSSATHLPSIDFGGLNPIGVSGFYKMILKWMKCFFTVPGTDLADLSNGTLVADALGGNIDATNATDIAHQSVIATTQKIQSYQTSVTPPAEQLATATLTKAVYNQSTASLDIFVTITNVTGETLVLNIPTGIRLPATST